MNDESSKQIITELQAAKSFSQMLELLPDENKVIFSAWQDREFKRIIHSGKSKAQLEYKAKTPAMHIYLVMSTEMNFVKIGYTEGNKTALAKRYNCIRKLQVAMFNIKKEQYADLYTSQQVETCVFQFLETFKVEEGSSTETFLRFKDDDVKNLANQIEFFTKIGETLESTALCLEEYIPGKELISIEHYELNDLVFFYANNIKYICNNLRKCMTEKKAINSKSISPLFAADSKISLKQYDDNARAEEENLYESLITRKDCRDERSKGSRPSKKTKLKYEDGADYAVGDEVSDIDEEIDEDMKISEIVLRRRLAKTQDKNILSYLNDVPCEGDSVEKKYHLKSLKINGNINDEVIDFKAQIYYAASKLQKTDNETIYDEYKQIVKNDLNAKRCK
jgi:hypothetical protein